ncbi:TrkA family potassium uptake protein [Thermobifida halotolerans]|uniref:Trk system potassium uptake protein TrkA n=1 Tax=Thermobifida halotolerans TaxID=483545 RepID=A0A399G3T9_9ACTN|nr:TrkA family potassium uptake protein [Thermobifida halotolerans]UOE21723.1 TrkA family potassium uptake protein [Thermobifida halotolerans]
MRVAIAGAGAVGRSIAAELLGSGHEVLLIDRDSRAIDVHALTDAEWLLADACEVSSLENARLDEFDAVVAATSDDKVNLVVSLLAKREFGVRRVVARVNDPRDEWLFTDAWGVDVAVSPPRLLAALVDDDEDAELGRAGETAALVSLGGADLLESALTEESPFRGRTVDELHAALPEGVVLVAVVQSGQARAPLPGTALAAGDVVVLLSSARSDDELHAVLSGAS